jgi:hypothetical protein
MPGINGAFTKSSYVNHDLRCAGNPVQKLMSQSATAFPRRSANEERARWAAHAGVLVLIWGTGVSCSAALYLACWFFF